MDSEVSVTTTQALVDLVIHFAEVIAFVGGIGTAIFVAGRHVGRIISKMGSMEQVMKKGFHDNHEDHQVIKSKLDEHSERITAVETIVERQCESKE